MSNFIANYLFPLTLVPSQGTCYFFFRSRDLTQIFLIPSAFRRVVCILVADVCLDKVFICVTARILNDQASIIATIMARIRTTIGAIISARAGPTEDLSSFRLSVKFPPHRQTVPSVV